MAKGSGRMLVIWRARRESAHPRPAEATSFEPGSERGRSSPGDSRGGFARGQTGSQEVRAGWAGVGSGWRPAQNAHGAGVALAIRAAGGGGRGAFVCAGAARGARLAQGGNAGGYGGQE